MFTVRTPKTYPLNTITRSESAEANDVYKEFLENLTTNASTKFIVDREVPIPESFEGRKQWSAYISPVKNQGECGGCYAFAAAAALADRYNLLSQGQLHINLSALKVINCDAVGQETDFYGRKVGRRADIIDRATARFGCSGNTLMEAWRYLYDIGTNTVECVGDDAGGTCIELMGPYLDTCMDGTTPAVSYRSQKPYAVPGVARDGGSEYKIRENIFIHGPVTTAMVVFPDFYTFDPSKDIYRSPAAATDRVGGHAIVLDGWGEEGGVKFWWARNSWGAAWGIGGYFKIERGTNCCELEENVFVGPPAIEEIGTLDLGEHIASTLNLDKLGPIRRIVTSTFVPSGGLDPRTGLSRRHLSYEENSDAQDIRRRLPIDPSKFVAGRLGHISKPAQASRRSSLLYICIAIVSIVTAVTFILLISLQ